MSQINAVLVTFSIKGGWTAKKTDKKATKEFTEEHNTSEDSGTWDKNLFPDSMFEDGEPNPYKEFKAAISKAKAVHYDLTAPWEKPDAIVKASTFEKYDAVLNSTTRDKPNDYRAKLEVTETAEAFFAAYEGLIERAKPKLNGTFNSDDYPPLERLIKRFNYNLTYKPIPESGHYVDIVAGPQLAKLRTELDRTNERRLQAAMADVWRRLLEPVQKLAEKMTEADPQFHNSIVGNIREMVAMIPQINITDDPAIAQAARTIQDALNTVNPERLRESQFARVEAAQKAIGLLGQFGQLGTRKIIQSPSVAA